jgi:hypothetical protein
MVSDERGRSTPDPACTGHSHGDQITTKPPRWVRVDPSPARGNNDQKRRRRRLIMVALAEARMPSISTALRG